MDEPSTAKRPSVLTIDRAAFLLLRVKRAFKKKRQQRKEKHAAAAAAAAAEALGSSTGGRRAPPPLLRSRTLPAIVVPGLSILHAQIDPQRSTDLSQSQQLCRGVSAHKVCGLRAHAPRISFTANDDGELNDLRRKSASSRLGNSPRSSIASEDRSDGIALRVPTPRSSVSSASSSGAASRFARLLAQGVRGTPEETGADTPRRLSWERRESFGQLPRSASIDSVVEAAICARHSEPSHPSILQLSVALRSDRALSLVSPQNAGRRTKTQRGQAENVVDNREAFTQSPLPQGAKNIRQDMPEVWEDVFGTANDNVIENQPYTLQPLQSVHNNACPVSANDTPNPNSLPLHVESSTENTRLLPPTPGNNDVLIPLALELPSSFENSPAVSYGDLPSISLPIYVSTPIPSPLNTHKDCHDTFCSVHNDDHWTPSPSTTNTNSAPNDSSDDVHSPPSKKRGKKRLRRRSEWSDVKRKCLKNIGKKYVTKKGKLVDEKTLGVPCRCRYKCFNKISQDQRYDCFQKFWRLGSREKQWAFVLKYSKKQQKNRCLNREVPNNRKFTYKYFLPVMPNLDQGHSETVDVCKTMFLNTLSVSGKIIKTAWEKYDGSTIVEEDMRGRHANHHKLIKPETVKSVCDHVRSFVPVESHYIRKTSTKLYLDGSLNIPKMYHLYKNWFNDSIYSSKALTVRQYRDIVNENFNLGFFIPKKDQCDVCHIFRNKNDHTEEEKVNYNNHLSNKNEARKLKNLDKRDAVESNGVVLTAVFDFQKVLSCPHGQVSIFYYKRKLSCLDFTIFDMAKKRAYCYMWDETVAKRGSNEVGSCLLDFIEQNVRNGVEEFRFWSDNCGGQNRNRFVFFLYTYCAKRFNVSIKHRFLEKGHTQNEGDSVHALIEREAEKKTIYTPEEWRLLVRWAKSTGDPYEVLNMTQNKFFELKTHVNNKIWCKNTDGVKVSWNSVREVFVDKSEPNKLMYKYDLKDIDYKTVLIRSNTRRNAGSSLPTLELAYKAPINLSKDKYKDLISLVNSGIIPSQYADYFRSLPYSTNNDDININSEEE